MHGIKMETDKEDNICALCKWNKSIENNFFCGHPKQENAKLRHETSYNDGCELFEENTERITMYDFEDKS